MSPMVHRRHGGAPRRGRALLVTLAAILMLGLAPTASATPGPMFLGTLGTSPTHAAQESKAGVKVAMMELSWRKYETSRGVFNLGYEREMVARLASLRAAGMQVTLGLGLHFVPAWVAAVPNSHFVDQYGNKSAEVDLVFNRHIRTLATEYLTRANAALHFSSIWAIRMTSGGLGEVLYPTGGHYWAFGVNAQNGSAKPLTMARNPFPGWKPGTGKLSTSQMLQWANWYVGALADVVRWQYTTVRSLGFTGFSQIVTPGTGIYARKLSTLAAAKLPNGTLGVGAAWSILYGKLKGLKNIVAYVSSVGDESGGKVGCRLGDGKLALDAPDTVWWSSTRWISHIAVINGFQKAGENPGLPTRTDSAATTAYGSTGSTGLMATAISMASSCGFQGLYWAHDDQFWSGATSFSKFTSYTSPTTPVPRRAP